MKKIIYVFLFLVMGFSGFSGNYILLQFNNKQNIPAMRFDENTKTWILNFEDQKLQSVFSGYKIIKFEQEYPAANKLNHPLAEQLKRYYKVVAAQGPEALYAALNNLTSTAIAGLDILNDPKLLYTPNDMNIAGFNFYGTIVNQQHLKLINAEKAWDYTHGDPNIVVGITDLDYDITHQDLFPKVISYSGFNYGGAYNWHGNSVSHLAAGATDNGLGFSSIGFNCMLRLYNAGYNEMLQAAMDGCKVINCSWIGSCSFIQSQQDIVDIIHYTYNAVIVAGAGNGPTALPVGGACGNGHDYVYPASYDHVISVTSVNHLYDPPGLLLPSVNAFYGIKDLHKEYYVPNSILYNEYTSTHNNKVDICAPGNVVPIIRFANNYTYGWGTSFASPIVAGVCALILSYNPNLTPDDVEAIIKCSSRDLMELQDNLQFAGKLGAGRVDAGKALELATNWTPGSVTTQYHINNILWFGKNANNTYTLLPEGNCTPGLFNYSQLRLVALPAFNRANVYKWVIDYQHSGATTFFNIKSVKKLNYVDLFQGVDYNSGLAERMVVAVRVNDCVPGNYYSETASWSPNCMDGRMASVPTATAQEKAETIQEKNLMIYPNPASNSITVKHYFNINNNWAFELKDMQGRIIYKGNSCKTEETISVNRFTNGTYLLEVNDGGTKIVKKVSILHN